MAYGQLQVNWHSRFGKQEQQDSQHSGPANRNIRTAGTQGQPTGTSGQPALRASQQAHQDSWHSGPANRHIRTAGTQGQPTVESRKTPSSRAPNVFTVQISVTGLVNVFFRALVGLLRHKTIQQESQ